MPQETHPPSQRLAARACALPPRPEGRGFSRFLVIVLAKLLGTALVARIFQLTQPALVQLAWFARLHGRWIAWKAAALARVRASRIWRVGRWTRRGVVRRIQRWRADV